MPAAVPEATAPPKLLKADDPLSRMKETGFKLLSLDTESAAIRGEATRVVSGSIPEIAVADRKSATAVSREREAASNQETSSELSFAEGLPPEPLAVEKGRKKLGKRKTLPSKMSPKHRASSKEPTKHGHRDAETPSIPLRKVLEEGTERVHRAVEESTVLTHKAAEERTEHAQRREAKKPTVPAKKEATRPAEVGDTIPKFPREAWKRPKMESGLYTSHDMGATKSTAPDGKDWDRKVESLLRSEQNLKTIPDQVKKTSELVKKTSELLKKSDPSASGVPEKKWEHLDVKRATTSRIQEISPAVTTDDRGKGKELLFPAKPSSADEDSSIEVGLTGDGMHSPITFPSLSCSEEPPSEVLHPEIFPPPATLKSAVMPALGSSESVDFPDEFPPLESLEVRRLTVQDLGRSESDSTVTEEEDRILNATITIESSSKGKVGDAPTSSVGMAGRVRPPTPPLLELKPPPVVAVVPNVTPPSVPPSPPSPSHPLVQRKPHSGTEPTANISIETGTKITDERELGTRIGTRDNRFRTKISKEQESGSRTEISNKSVSDTRIGRKCSSDASLVEMDVGGLGILEPMSGGGAEMETTPTSSVGVQVGFEATPPINLEFSEDVEVDELDLPK